MRNDAGGRRMNSTVNDEQTPSCTFLGCTKLAVTVFGHSMVCADHFTVAVDRLVRSIKRPLGNS